jgi:hypothetical protein
MPHGGGVVAQRIGRTVDSATKMLWALISTEPIDQLLVDSGGHPEAYAYRFAQLLRSTSITPMVS